jgi:hypothetical protein
MYIIVGIEVMDIAQQTCTVEIEAMHIVCLWIVRAGNAHRVPGYLVLLQDT